LLPLNTFTALVQQFAAAAQGVASALLDFTVGAAVRAIGEATSSVALWLQWVILLVLQKIRAATSVGTDLDTWMADFGLTRLPAVASSGSVTFSAFTPLSSASLIPVGANVKTADGTRTFAVIADTTNGLWNTAMGGYLVPVGATSATVPVQDVTTDATGNLSVGTAGNVAAGAISLIATAISGMDAVTNASAFGNGIDAESDPAFRARFSLYIQTRSQATKLAVAYATLSVQQGLSYTIQENEDVDGAQDPGSFIVTVDDGTGSPPSQLLSNIRAAIDVVRPLNSVYVVQGPTVISVTVAFTMTTNPTTNKPNLLAPAETAVQDAINALPPGSTLSYGRLFFLVFGVDPSITDVQSMLVNGGASDITSTASQSIKATSVVAS
jgi:phage-related baseplate assembly protein